MELDKVRAENTRHKIWYAEINERYKLSPLLAGDGNWTYGGKDGDEHVEAVERLPIVFLGFNPGSGNGATTHQMTPSERSWRTRCSRLAQVSPKQIVFAELISLPTLKQGGLDAAGSLEELMLGSLALNKAIIAYHKPKIIFQTGISAHHLALVEKLYELKDFQAPEKRESHSTETLFHSYSMDGIPWIAFKHFASMGFSIKDRQKIRLHAKGRGWKGDPDWITANPKH